jgi:AcrR family transcriptional regulator
MSKGEQTRAQIIKHAMDHARVVGLEGLSLATLAESAQLSKSGLFAHFKSKETLQLEVIAAAAEHFRRTIVSPALKQPRGEARVRALFGNYINWIVSGAPSGCIFMSLGHEFGDRPGPVRDRLLTSQKEWRDCIVQVAEHAVTAGYLRPELNAEQFAFEFMGVATAFEYALKLLENPRASALASRAFEDLLRRSRAEQ